MLCSVCGAELKDGDTYCHVCGAYVELNELIQPENSAGEVKILETIPDGNAHNIQLPIGTVIRGRYSIMDIIGRGGFCYTYKAMDNVLGVEVAVKEYFPKSVAKRYYGEVVSVATEADRESFSQGKDRFLNEARHLAQFNGNPGIVNIYDYFDENNTAYIVMEFLKGQNISQYMKYIGGIPDYTFTAYIADRICDILSQVHERGIVHRDLSPDNIFLCENGEVKLIDFGAVAKRNDSVINTEVLEVILKPGYTPVEQYNTRGAIGAWTDVYALAATLYKMTTGIVPQEAILRANRDAVIPPHMVNSNIPLEFSMAIMQALSIEPNERYSNMVDFKAALFGQNTPSQELERTDYEVAPVYDQAKLNGMNSGVLTSTSVLMSTDNYYDTTVLMQTGGLYGYVEKGQYNPYIKTNNQQVNNTGNNKLFEIAVIALFILLVIAIIILIIFIIKM